MADGFESVVAWAEETLERIKSGYSPIVYAPYRKICYTDVMDLPYPVPDDQSELDSATVQMAKDHDDYFWPHKRGCPLCGSDAYVGFAHAECSNGSCNNFVYRKGT